MAVNYEELGSLLRAVYEPEIVDWMNTDNRSIINEAFGLSDVQMEIDPDMEMDEGL